MLGSDRQFDKTIAESVFGWQVEVVKPEWYPYDVYLFRDPISGNLLYSLDENACNAMMYRNGVDATDGTLPPLPHFSVCEELEVIEMIHRAMISSAGLRIHYYCNPGSNGNISYNVEIVRQPKSLPKRCWGEDGKTLGDALVSALRKFLEIVKEEHGNV